MQAISTKYLGPTNHRGGRVKAKCQAGSVTVEWDHARGIEENHDAACRALLIKLGWTLANGYKGTWSGGGTPDGTGNTYVYRHHLDTGWQVA